ncbi:MAG: hypothetical protein JWN93_493 [Hyphomicrobiales bacterium]|jgi:Flp pilus assembly protein TadG|nr:hypothetical protein [Hyphomicrobiales bacterium]
MAETGSGIARCERGGGLLELALIAPLLVVLAAGVFEFSRIYASIEIANASMRAATRYLARVPSAGVQTWGLERARCLATRGAPAAAGSCDGVGACMLRTWCDAGARATIQVDASMLGSAAPRVSLKATIPFQFGVLALFKRSAQLSISVAHEEAYVGD